MKTLFMLFSNRKLTELMQHFDVFERSKVVMQPLVRAGVIDAWGEANLKALLEHCKGSDSDLIAVFDLDRVYYRNPAIQSVSSGRSWTTLDNYLAHCGLRLEESAT